jgi:predicted RNA-binding protein with RPS1 domain
VENSFASMDKLIQSIQDISDAFPDRKKWAIEEIHSIDLSSYTIEQIRDYVQTLQNIARTTVNIDQGNCCNLLLHKLTSEERSRPFHEQFPEVNMTIEGMKEIAASLLTASKTQATQLKQLQNMNRKHDKKLEEFINNAVAQYFKGTVILSGYDYTTEAGDEAEVDGIVVGNDENGKASIVFIETKSDMDSGWKDAKTQMLRTISHWRYLRELVSSETNEIQERVKNDIEKFQVAKYKDYIVRCAFGANYFKDETLGQLRNDFKKYKWLRVTKNVDDNYKVTRQD